MKRANSLKNPTFDKYLRWYDLREEGFSYRTIASVEISKSAGEAIEYFRKNKRIDKANVKGEDAVEKGYKVIYEAIHHKKYNSKRCPTQLWKYTIALNMVLRFLVLKVVLTL